MEDPLKTLVVYNAQTEMLAVKCGREYNPVASVPGQALDVILCTRTQQNEVLGASCVVRPEDMEECGGPGSAWLCCGDYLLNPETGDPILRVFKP